MASFYEQVQNAFFNIGVGTAGVLTVVALFLVKGVINGSSLPLEEHRRPAKSKRHIKYIEINDDIVERFSKAIQCETVSWGIDHSSPEELLKLHAVIKESFPHVHSSPLVKCEVINQYSLLYTVKGSNASLKPYVLISHLDVVPVTDHMWNVPPFSGVVEDDYIWGRGTIDVKNGVMGSLEALEFLLKSGHSPSRGFFLAFGHDEEVFGQHGAAYVAKLLVSRGVSLEFVHDEGMVVVDDIFPGITSTVAAVGVAEKGSLSIELKVDGSAGHASMPTKESSIGILSNAIAKIERNPIPSTFGYGPEIDMLKTFAPVVPLLVRIILSNLWLFKPLVAWMLARKPATNALVRSTIAVTRIQGGTKDNVIPASAMAHLNIRIHHGDTVDSIIQHLRRCINDDRVQIITKIAVPHSHIASTASDSFGYNTIASSILEIFPDVLVAPGLLVAGTDSKHFEQLTSEIYRFMPSHLKMADLPRIHGANERISVKNYEETINFYYRLMLNADKASL